MDNWRSLTLSRNYLDRKDQLENKNTNKVDDFRQVLLERAQETEQKLKEFVSKQTNQYEDLKDNIANFVERKNSVRLVMPVNDNETYI